MRISACSVCTACDAGMFTPDTGSAECIDCPVGTYSSDDAHPDPTCATCGSTAVAGLTAGSTECTTCPDFSKTVDGAVCNCNTGYGQITDSTIVCEICPAGTYATGGTSSECWECPMNEVTSLDGQTSCSACGDATYAPRFGATLCSR